MASDVVGRLTLIGPHGVNFRFRLHEGHGIIYKLGMNS